jgi:DNA polymerase I
MKTYYVILDCSYFCYRCAYSMPKMETRSGVRSEIVYGFLQELLSLPDRIRGKIGAWAFSWDSPRSRRRNRYPWYKSRPKTEAEREALRPVFEQMHILREEVLPGIGFRNLWYADGYESDDLIARGVQSQPGDVIIMTPDEDMYQLISPTVQIFHPAKGQFITLPRFHQEYGIPPEDWVKVKQIAGCTSDTIPGIRGVGTSTAVQYLRGILKPESSRYQSIVSGSDIIEANRWLVELPLPGTPEVKWEVDSCREWKDFERVCREWEFDSFLEDDRAEEWFDFLIGGDSYE